VSRAKKAQKLTSIAAYRLTSAICAPDARRARQHRRGALDRVIIVGIMDKGQHRVRDQVHRRDVMLDLRGRIAIIVTPFAAERGMRGVV
jgi:hypothetical protein